MAARWTMALVDDEAPEATATADEAAPVMVNPGRFHAVMILENAWSGDYRFVQQDALTWRDLPFALMATDETSERHEGAQLVGHFDTVERIGSEIHGWGNYVSNPNEEQAHLIQMIQNGELPWFSADMDEVVAELMLDMGPTDEQLTPEEQEQQMLEMMLGLPSGEDEELEELEDGHSYLVIPMPTDRYRVTSARLIGGTAVPMQAFQEATIGPDTGEEAVAASLVASITIPVEPPSAWFVDPQLDQVTAWTVTDEGEIVGHLAAWNSCHIGMPGCTPPPRSLSNYAHFMTGQIITADGERFAVGQITLKGGHADMHLSAREARQHYDDTRSAFCDVAVGEDEHGIWVHGALRPGLDPASVRMAMAHDVSGDWRMIGRGLELIGACSVNVPGFMKPRFSTYTERGMVASAVIAQPLLAFSKSERLKLAAAERIAMSIGRSTKQRREALRARVHGGS